ncbi:hypothetical protein [Chitinibacter sp. S2-10]|uniref:hypothetical protein n=1 Tax=Chitinibacter sp. S2-10 TaxID=3373597 RepID=UPI0039777043
MWIRRGFGARPFYLQLGLPMALVISMALGLIGFLNYFNYQKSYQELLLDRALVLGIDARQLIESGLNIGLAPRANANLAPELNRLYRESGEVHHIQLCDERGQSLLLLGDVRSTQPCLVPPVAKGEAAEWQTQDASFIYMGLPYKNSFGVVSGYLVLAYPQALVSKASATMGMKLLQIFALVVLAVFAVTIVCVWWLTRQMQQEISQLEQIVDQPDQASPAPEFGLLDNALSAEVREFSRMLQPPADLVQARES